MTQRLSLEAKHMRGTLRPQRERNQQARRDGLLRVIEPIAPPTTFSAELKQQWNLHQQLLIAAGMFSVIDLRGFVAMCRCAELLEQAYEAAQRTGPTVETGSGSIKTSAAWSAWLATDAAYQRHLDAFGLRPHAHQRVSTLLTPEAAVGVVK